MSGGDIRVNLDALEAHALRWQEHINALEDRIGEMRGGPIGEAKQSCAWFGGFPEAMALEQRHLRLVNEMLDLVDVARGGLAAAKAGIEQTKQNYRDVDDQHSKEFDTVTRMLPDERGEGDDE